MSRRTKIVATIGPASDHPGILGAMVEAGMNAARVSLAHGSLEEALERLERIRTVTGGDAPVGVLGDLPGPKIRAGAFPEGGVELAGGTLVELVPGGEQEASGARRITVDHPAALAALREDDRVALGDGAVELLVRQAGADLATAEVLAGGWVQGRPGLALPSGSLTIASPTPKDLKLLEALAEAEIDAVAISFVRSAADILRARASIGEGGPMLIAKIETQEAVDALEEIIAVADGVMVARGDLGIRCRLEDVPHHQKRIIRTGVAFGRPVITATQMLESMVRAPAPTRAEVSDIANAVFDGTSALMLSGETAIGHDPVAAVRTMARVATRAEQEFDNARWGRELGRQQTDEAHGAPARDRITAAISAAAWRAAGDAEVAAIIACTEMGNTAKAISRYRPTMPVLAATPSFRTARQLAIAWGISPILTGRHSTTDDIVWFAVKAAVENGSVRRGDLVAVLVGSPSESDAMTDTLRMVRVQ
ncbi:MAG: pyruvate kinase [Actinobacteria bacterium]|nr:pyruvate kinase [Actinomycetota bacterium]